MSSVPHTKESPLVDFKALQYKSVDDAWPYIVSMLQRLLDVVSDSSHKAKFTRAEYSALYSIVYNLSITKSPGETMSSITPMGRRNIHLLSVSSSSDLPRANQDILYDKYEEWIASYMKHIVVPAIHNVEGEALLVELVDRWEQHKIILSWLRKLFTYLDRYCTRQGGKEGLKLLGLRSFNKFVFEDVNDKVLKTILFKIERERCGDIIDRSKMKSAIEIFIEMGLGDLRMYKTQFEAPFVKDTRRFYQRTSAERLESCTIPEYLAYVEQCYSDENDRVDHYLHPRTREKVNQSLGERLLDAHLDSILRNESSGFVALLRNHDLLNLTLMFRLLKDRPGSLEEMSRMFNEEIRREGDQHLTFASETEDYDLNLLIIQFLQMYDMYGSMCQRQFDNSNLFLKSMKDAFESFVNSQVTVWNEKVTSRVMIVEIFSSFCDTILKASQREKYEYAERIEPEILFEKIVNLLQFFVDKDFFQDSYRDHLSKRLLDSLIDEAEERSFISKLKMKYGASFTSKMETMITDRNLSREQSEKFKVHLKENERKLPINDFQAVVLTESSWPHFSPDQYYHPCDELQVCMDEFTSFYGIDNRNRVLHWIHSLGKVVLTGYFAKAPRDLSMTAYQASVCILFNSYSEISVADAIQLTGIQSDELKRAVMGLVAGKYKIIHRTGDGKSLLNDEILSFNPKFESKKIKISVPLPKKTVKKSTEKQQERDGERKHAVEAAAVRIMKSRKQLLHHELVSEILELLKLFRPQPKLIKERIEDLITRDFLRRDEQDNQKYHYVA